MRLACMRTVFKSLILAWTFATALTKAVAGETIYFLVGEIHSMVTGYNDSYVLPLSKAEDISHARYLVSRYGLARLFGGGSAARRGQSCRREGRYQSEFPGPEIS